MNMITQKNKKIGVTLMVSLMILLGFIFISPASAQTTNVSISSSSADAGTTVQVPIIAHNVTDLGNFAVKLTYDPTVVNVTGATLNPDLGTSLFDFTYASSGSVDLGTLNWGDPIPSVSGETVLLVTVNLTAVGDVGKTSLLGLTISKMQYQNNTEFDATAINGTFRVTGIPTGPYVTINDASANTGTTTTTSIIAHNVTDLGNFAVKLTYDPTVVNVTGATLNPDLGTSLFDFTYASSGSVDLGTLNWEDPIPSVSGETVLLATVNLTAVGDVGKTSPLGLTISKMQYQNNTVFDATAINGTFTVAAIAPAPLLITAGPTATAITYNSATITWTTNRSATSEVRYGTTSEPETYPNTATDGLGTSHSVALTDLTSSTTYYYVVYSEAPDGGNKTSSEKTFATTAMPIATITGFSVTPLSQARGKTFTAGVELTSTASEGWYTVVVSGTNTVTGEALAGTGVIKLGTETQTIPVLVYIPAGANTEQYELYAVLYKHSEYPTTYIDKTSEVAVTVT